MHPAVLLDLMSNHMWRQDLEPEACVFDRIDQSFASASQEFIARENGCVDEDRGGLRVSEARARFREPAKPARILGLK